MKHIPRQHEIESFLDDIFQTGDREALAAILDCSPSLISQEFNPNNPDKKSKFYQASRQMWGAYQIRRELGDMMIQKLNCMARKWRGNGAVKNTLPHLIGRVSSECSDSVIAELEKKPIDVRLLEAMQLEATIRNYIDGLCQDGENEDRKVS